jgi:hypothetical protein
MNTIRDLLFKRHRAAGPRLDDIRRSVLEELSRTREPRSAEDQSVSLAYGRRAASTHSERGAISSVRELLRSCRWHLAALSGAWGVVAFLNLAPSPGERTIATVPSRPTAQEVMLALRENRRQLMEWIGLPGDTISAPTKPKPSRRSQAVPASALV